MAFNIMSLNCRGLGGLEKRRDVLNYIKQKNFSIYLLQDTHLTMEDYNQIRSLWGFEIFLSPGKSNARGTAILFNNNFEYKIYNEYKDQEGNLIVLEINIYDKYDLLVLNIYSPNMDNPDFFLKISEIISDFNGDFVILAGDFNLVQDPSLDNYNYNVSITKNLEKLS